MQTSYILLAKLNTFARHFSFHNVPTEKVPYLGFDYIDKAKPKQLHGT
jgi:hypothetical protein